MIVVIVAVVVVVGVVIVVECWQLSYRGSDPGCDVAAWGPSLFVLAVVFSSVCII